MVMERCWLASECVAGAVWCGFCGFVVLWCCCLWLLLWFCRWLCGATVYSRLFEFQSPWQLRADVETSFGYLWEGHGYSCVSALVWNSHHVDIRSSASKPHCVNSSWDHRKKRDEEGLLSIVRSAIYHELPRTQLKLERKCVSVGVDAFAFVWWKILRLWRKTISVIVHKPHPLANYLHHGFNQCKNHFCK